MVSAAGLREAGGFARVEFFLGSRHREFDASDLNAADFAAGLRRSVGIGVGQCMTKMTARGIRMPLSNGNSTGHAVALFEAFQILQQAMNLVGVKLEAGIVG
jgi:hypothetical protein